MNNINKSGSKNEFLSDYFSPKELAPRRLGITESEYNLECCLRIIFSNLDSNRLFQAFDEFYEGEFERGLQGDIASLNMLRKVFNEEKAKSITTKQFVFKQNIPKKHFVSTTSKMKQIQPPRLKAS